MIHIMECYICNKMTKANLVILGRNICSCCEKKIIQAETKDQSYSKYQEGVKELLKPLKQA